MAAGDVDVALTNPKSIACASFDGVDDKITVGEIGKTTNTPISFSCWFKTRATTTQYIMSDTNGSNNTFIALITAATARFYIGQGSAGYFAFSTGTATVDVWHHFCGVYDGTNVMIWIDNVQGTNASNATSPNQSSSATAMTIGNVPAGGSTFNGFIRDIRLWNRALTTAEVSNLYSAAGPGDMRANFKLNTSSLDSVSGISGSDTGVIYLNDAPLLDTAITSQRSTVGSASGQYLMCDSGSGVITVAIDEA